jgi:hypothetical protein
MNSKALFIETVRATEGLPASLREHADDIQNVRESRFDDSYIEFLDTQIRLSPRGPEWTERLKRRRAALLPFCDVTLLRGRVRVGQKEFTVQIDPRSKAVIHWEQYDYDDVAS